MYFHFSIDFLLIFIDFKTFVDSNEKKAIFGSFFWRKNHGLKIIFPPTGGASVRNLMFQ